MNIIPGWDCLVDKRAIKEGTPDEYVVFATSGYIPTVFDDEAQTATATIGQRDKAGRLFQNSLHSRHFCPRKFTITVNEAEAQIRVLHSLTAALNDGTIAPDSIPRKVSSVRAWDAICNLLKVSGGADSA